MVEPAPTPDTLLRRTPVAHTTRRGFATASFALAFWGTVVFWWYPFGLALCALGFLFGLIAIAFGIRAGKEGEHIAWLGVAISAIGLGLAIGVYRFVQYAFEGSMTGGLFD